MKRNVVIWVCAVLFGFQSGSVMVLGKDGGETHMQASVAIFDVSKEDTQMRQVVYDSVGQKVVVTVYRDMSLFGTRGTQLLSRETYTISYTSLSEKISFKVDVLDHQFVSVHSGVYSVFGYQVNSSKLSLIHRAHALYVLECSFLFRSWTNQLNVRMHEDSLMVVSVND